MKWIAETAEVEALVRELSTESAIAVDTEADSLHSYFDKVCLVQISANGADFIIDPLAGADIRRLAPLLSDPNVQKVFHGADYDLRILDRDFGIQVRNLFDTSVAAQLLGYNAFGLGALLERHFGLTVDKSHQKADWAMRPLPPAMLAYATQDTRHLVALRDRMVEELREAGRLDWAVEEFERLELIRHREQEETEAFRRMKGSAKLSRRSLAALQRLHAWRDVRARRVDRPPFKILGNDALLEIAETLPADLDGLRAVPALSRPHFERHARELLAIISEVLALPENELPQKGESRGWMRDRDVERRVETLKKVRDGRAQQLGVSPSILAPKHVLTAVAVLAPASVEQLDEIPAMRRWQKREIGEALVAALRR